MYGVPYLKVLAKAYLQLVPLPWWQFSHTVSSHFAIFASLCAHGTLAIALCGETKSCELVRHHKQCEYTAFGHREAQWIVSSHGPNRRRYHLRLGAVATR